MNLRKTCALGLVAVSLFGFAGTAAAQTVDIGGPVTKANGTKSVGTFAGTFTLERFQAKGDQLLAVGTVSGTVTDADGKVVKEIGDRRAAFPVDLAKSGVGGGPVSTALQPGPGSCDVLNLVLGPLDLNLLGLEIDLDQVVLDIVANPAGGLLGQILSILCGLNLLDILDGLLGSLNLLAGFLNLLALLSNLPF